MPLTVAQGFDKFLGRLVPTTTEREQAASHRSSVKSAIDTHLDAVTTWETGSFKHGTAIRGHADVDLLVSFGGGSKPQYGTSALQRVQQAMRKRFTITPVVIRSPAVVIQFGTGQSWELIPGFIKDTSGDFTTYDAPRPGGGWMVTSPRAHLGYVNLANDEPAGGAKKLARLLKAWKYYQHVPISSFYLEMRAAQYMRGETGWVAIYDLTRVLNSLESHNLAAMNDPLGITGRIAPCSSDASLATARSRLATAAGRARRALGAYQDDKHGDAFDQLNLLFAGNFPSRWS